MIDLNNWIECKLLLTKLNNDSPNFRYKWYNFKYSIFIFCLVFWEIKVRKYAIMSLNVCLCGNLTVLTLISVIWVCTLTDVVFEEKFIFDIGMDYTKLSDDIWSEIFSYLDLKSIFTMELADRFFQQTLKRIRFWERKLKTDFDDGLDEAEVAEEDQYFIVRRMYWNRYLLSHECRICNLCFIDNICSDIPDCKNCDWLDCLWIVTTDMV